MEATYLQNLRAKLQRRINSISTSIEDGQPNWFMMTVNLFWEFLHSDSVTMAIIQELNNKRGEIEGIEEKVKSIVHQRDITWPNNESEYTIIISDSSRKF
jgi:hypothetical protein